MNEQQWKLYLEREDIKVRLLEDILHILKLLQKSQHDRSEAIFVCEVDE